MEVGAPTHSLELAVARQGIRHGDGVHRDGCLTQLHSSSKHQAVRLVAEVVGSKTGWISKQAWQYLRACKQYCGEQDPLSPERVHLGTWTTPSDISFSPPLHVASSPRELRNQGEISQAGKDATTSANRAQRQRDWRRRA